MDPNKCTVVGCNEPSSKMVKVGKSEAPYCATHAAAWDNFTRGLGIVAQVMDESNKKEADK